MENKQSKQEEQKIFALMQKNSTYYEAIFRRPNVFKEIVLGFVFSGCSLPRLVLEVFLRRNMGERYFSMGAVVTISVIITFLAWQTILVGAMMGEARKSVYMSLGLFLFLPVFLYFGVRRSREIKRLPSVFDFARFSLATGQTLPFFDRFTTNRRKLTTIYEPAACFIVGALFLLIAQLPLAALLMTCSVIYSLSYIAAYHQGDNFLMDKIDERICAEDLGKTFAANIPYDKTRGAEYFGHQAETPKERQRIGSMLGDDTAYEAS